MPRRRARTRRVRLLRSLPRLCLCLCLLERPRLRPLLCPSSLARVHVRRSPAPGFPRPLVHLRLALVPRFPPRRPSLLLQLRLWPRIPRTRACTSPRLLVALCSWPLRRPRRQSRPTRTWPPRPRCRRSRQAVQRWPAQQLPLLRLDRPPPVGSSRDSSSSQCARRVCSSTSS